MRNGNALCSQNQVSAAKKKALGYAQPPEQETGRLVCYALSSLCCAIRQWHAYSFQSIFSQAHSPPPTTLVKQHKTHSSSPRKEQNEKVPLRPRPRTNTYTTNHNGKRRGLWDHLPPCGHSPCLDPQPGPHLSHSGKSVGGWVGSDGVYVCGGDRAESMSESAGGGKGGWH